MPGSENTDALSLPRYKADKSDLWSTSDTRSIVNTIDAQFDTGATTASGDASGGAAKALLDAAPALNGAKGVVVSVFPLQLATTQKTSAPRRHRPVKIRILD